MNNEQLYEAIFRRRSVRKYDMTPLSATTLAAVQELARQAKPLDERIKYKLTYLGTSDVKNLLPIKAPHYLCLYSEQQDGYLLNAGFVLQQVDLYLSAHGLGSCWLGMAKPSKQVPQQQDGLEFVIMLAFGQSSEPIHRHSSADFKRLSLSAITSIVDSSLCVLLRPPLTPRLGSSAERWTTSSSAARSSI